MKLRNNRPCGEKVSEGVVRKIQNKVTQKEAMHFTNASTGVEIVRWAHPCAILQYNQAAQGDAILDEVRMVIETLEGTHIANKGDWIIKGLKGEFYPCKPDIFEKSYELVD